MFKKKKQFVTFQKFENNFFFENKVPNEEFVSPVVCIWVSIPPPHPQKHPPSVLPSPPWNWQTVQGPLFRQSPLYIGFL